MKKLLPLLFIFIGFSVSAQVGIGTDMPNPSSQLEIVANDKGLLIPQVALLNLTDESTITNGNVESLLVFNTSTNQSMSPGYYYWYNGSWKRIATSNDPTSNIPDNIVIWNVENQEFVYLDQEGDRISINLDEIVNESITKLVDNLDGTYTYTSEDDTITTINVPADVISNIDNNGDIYERIIELITSNSYISNITDNGDGTFNFTDSQGNTTEFDANTTNLVDNADGTYDLTNANGSTININTNADSNSYDNTNSGLAAGNVQDALDEIQQNLEDTNADLGNIDLTDNGDGTFTYTDAEGNIIDFDANTTSYTENGGGSYTFTNDNGESITVTVVDDVVSNIQNQGAIYNEILSIIGNESDILVDNNNGTYTHTAVDGTEVIIDANTTSVSVADGVYTFTNGNGDVITTIDTNASASGYDNTNSGLTSTNVQDALDEIQQNLEDTNADLGNIDLTDNGDGTFTYTDAEGNIIDFDANTTSYTENGGGSYTFTNDNGESITVTVVDDVVSNIQNQGAIYDEILSIIGNESDILIDNNNGTYTHTAVDGTEVIIDANTTSVSVTDGVYTFTDASGNTITTIDTNADAIAFDNKNNDFTSTNVQAALEELLTELENGFGNLTIKDNEDGSFSLLGSDGTTVLGTVAKSNLIDNTDGSYTFSNNDGTDVAFDVKTVDVSFNATNNEYEFKDSEGNVIGSIDMNANNVAFDNTNNNFVATDVQAALEEIQSNLDNTTDKLVDNNNGTYTHTAVDGTEVIIDANTTSVSVTDGVYTFIDAAGNTITSIDTNADAIAFDNTNNDFISTNVQAALEELLTELETGFGNLTIQDNEDGSFSLLGSDGTTVLGTVTKSNLSDNTDGSYTFTNNDGTDVAFDVKTVDVSFNATNNEYEFKDSEGNVIGSIDMNANNVAFDNTNNNFVATDVQAALEEIQSNLDNTTDKLVDNNNGTYTHTAVNGAEIIIDANTTSVSVTDGVYTFTDAAGNTITSVDTNADAIAFDNTTNDFTSTNVQAALEELLTELETGFGNLTIKDNEDGSFSLLGSDGTTVLGTVTKSNLTDNTDGSYTFTNNDGTDVAFDVKTVDVSFNATNNEYEFKDSKGNVIGSIDMNANNVAFDNSTNNFTANNVQTAIEELANSISNNKGDLSLDGGLEFTGTTTGLNKLLDNAGIQIADAGISTAKLANGAVTTGKISDAAITSVKIGNGQVTTANLADQNVTAGKLVANGIDEGKVATVNADGSVSYQSISASNLAETKDLTAGDASITVTDGTGATLVNTNVKVADAGISTAKLADGAVTTNKIAGSTANQVLITDNTGNPAWVNQTEIAEGVTADNALTKVDKNIQLGGELVKPTTVITNAINTLAIEGLQAGNDQDQIVVADPTSGVLKQLKAAMPRFFYMPSIIIPTDATQVPPGETFGQINLHQRYADQFSGSGTSGLVSNPGNTTTLPILPANELDYYITWYDTNVFQNVSVSDAGILSYDVLNNADITVGSFMNIVFVVKP